MRWCDVIQSDRGNREHSVTACMIRSRLRDCQPRGENERGIEPKSASAIAAPAVSSSNPARGSCAESLAHEGSSTAAIMNCTQEKANAGSLTEMRLCRRGIHSWAPWMVAS